MTFTILDKNFEPVAEITEAISVIWNRRFFSPGTWQITCSSREMQNLMAGEYVYRSDRKELGIIQQLGLSRDAAESKTCYAKGYFAEQLLYDRVLDRKMTGNDVTPEGLAKAIVRYLFVDGTGYEGRANAHIQVAPTSEIPQDNITFQGEGRACADVCYEVEGAQGMSHKMSYDDSTKMLTFDVVKGEDKGVEFQDTLRNVLNASYSQDRTETANVVYVAGAGDDDERVVIRIDKRKEGDPAKETYVDGRSLSQSYKDANGETVYYSDEEYQEMLITRGYQALESKALLESFSLEVDPNSDVLKYMVDYDLGDICSIRVSVDGGGSIYMTKQITEIREAIEKQSMSVSVTFGTPAKTSVRKYVKAEAATNVQTSNAGVGNLANLKTENKRTLVDAINEVQQGGGGGGGGGGDLTPRQKLEYTGMPAFIPDTSSKNNIVNVYAGTETADVIGGVRSFSSTSSTQLASSFYAAKYKRFALPTGKERIIMGFFPNGYGAIVTDESRPDKMKYAFPYYLSNVEIGAHWGQNAAASYTKNALFRFMASPKLVGVKSDGNVHYGLYAPLPAETSIWTGAANDYNSPREFLAFGVVDRTMYEVYARRGERVLNIGTKDGKYMTAVIAFRYNNSPYRLTFAGWAYVLMNSLDSWSSSDWNDANAEFGGWLA